MATEPQDLGAVLIAAVYDEATASASVTADGLEGQLNATGAADIAVLWPGGSVEVNGTVIEAPHDHASYAAQYLALHLTVIGAVEVLVRRGWRLRTVLHPCPSTGYAERGRWHIEALDDE